MRESEWIFLDCDQAAANHLSARLHIPLLTAKVLLNRGYTVSSAKAFLENDPSALHDPYLLPGMTKAVDRIHTAIAAQESIAVYGDYDVDGITATYIVYDYLHSMGADVRYYIPNRLSEGYGVNCAALESLTGCSLIITVDTGITAVSQVAFASEHGMDMIITDHHNPQDEIPSAVAVIDPKLPGSQYPFPNLAGAGVAFKLVLALSDNSRDVFRRYCPIATIGTVADIVSLTGENRIIVALGLDLLKSTNHPGLCALMDTAGIDKTRLSAASIGFGIGPRINAAGRIGSASAALELLLARQQAAAAEIAEQLEQENRRRQEEEKRILEQALKTIETLRLYDDGVIVVDGTGWHHGVIGIVSSRITERYYKPSIVVSFDETGIGKASGRSIRGFNLFEALLACAQDLEQFGGHDMAAGLSIQREKLLQFRTDINAFAKPRLTQEILTPKLYIDAAIELPDISLPTLEGLNRLEPCGTDNRAPIFCILDTTLKQLRISGTHAFLTVEKHGRTATIPAFGAADELRNYGPGDQLDMAGALSSNTYNGFTQAQFLAREIRISRSYRLTRSDVGMVFVFLKTNGDAPFSLERVKAFIYDQYRNSFTNKKILLCFQILKELSIAECRQQNGLYQMEKGTAFSGKTNLTQSATFMKFQTERQV